LNRFNVKIPFNQVSVETLLIKAFHSVHKVSYELNVNTPMFGGGTHDELIFQLDDPFPPKGIFKEP
jgi:hypothetical protein